jgi:hypothetical protein
MIERGRGDIAAKTARPAIVQRGKIGDSRGLAATTITSPRSPARRRPDIARQHLEAALALNRREADRGGYQLVNLVAAAAHAVRTRGPDWSALARVEERRLEAASALADWASQLRRGDYGRAENFRAASQILDRRDPPPRQLRHANAWRPRSRPRDCCRRPWMNFIAPARQESRSLWERTSGPD